MSLPPKGSKIALASGSTRGSLGSICIYNVAAGGVLALDKPWKRLETEDVVAQIDWAPDESNLAVLAASVKTLAVKTVNLTGEQWKTLVTMPLREGTDVDITGLLKMLSWTQ